MRAGCSSAQRLQRSEARLIEGGWCDTPFAAVSDIADEFGLGHGAEMDVLHAHDMQVIIRWGGVDDLCHESQRFATVEFEPEANEHRGRERQLGLHGDSDCANVDKLRFHLTPGIRLQQNALVIGDVSLGGQDIDDCASVVGHTVVGPILHPVDVGAIEENHFAGGVRETEKDCGELVAGILFAGYAKSDPLTVFDEGCGSVGFDVEKQRVDGTDDASSAWPGRHDDGLADIHFPGASQWFVEVQLCETQLKAHGTEEFSVLLKVGHGFIYACIGIGVQYLLE